LKILVTGATGTIGHDLCVSLLKSDHQVKIVTRRSETDLLKSWELPVEIVTWESPESTPFPKGNLDDVEAVIHLSGESINQKWTDSAKQRILNSRTKATQYLSQAIQEEGKNIKVFVGTSAIGIYPNSGTTPLNEKSDVDSSDAFLPMVCRKWEQASEDLSKHLRRVIIRVGLVLKVGEGFLGQLEPLYQKGVAGPIGMGQRQMSWIHIDDLVRMFQTAVEDERFEGIYNGTAPQPVSNSQFNEEFSKAMHLPNIAPVPPIALKLLYGEMSALALSDQKILPEASLEHGFQFHFTEIKQAFQDLYSWKTHYLDRRYYQWQWLNKDLDSTFEFFLSPYNLEQITPDFLNFKVLKSSTEKVEKNTKILYRISLRGIPMKWQTKILEMIPNQCFIDNQEKGPYSKWHHIHRFESLKNGTYLTDEVTYRLPVGPLGSLFAGTFVKSDVSRIFRFRFEKLRKLVNH
tara:strand:+ start:121645 stop:123027 length:1383 start_codon:yes stop_codon:yes gene_type:complete